MIPLLLAQAIQLPLIAQAAPSAARPQAEPTYPYVSLQLGVGFPNDYDGDFSAAGIPVDTSFELDPGFNGELAIGYQFERVRTELALGYSNLPVASQNFRVGDLGRASSSSSDALSVTTVMVNGYLDIPIRNRDGERSRWTPYLGGGIGYANIQTPECGFSSDCFQGGSGNAFAYQGKVGVAFRASERGFAFLEGGYLGASGTNVDGVGFDHFGTWRLSLGWRQGFGGAPKAAKLVRVEAAPEPEPSATPAPAPVSAPAPMPVRGLW